MRPRLVAAGIAALLTIVAAALAVALLDRDLDIAAAGGSTLPRCAELPGSELGPRGKDPSWGGCTTDEGVAVQSYVYECAGLRVITPPRGERRLAEKAAVVVIPDAGVVGAAGQPWQERDHRTSFLRTPFAMLVPFRCDGLRSLPHDGVDTARCDLDGVPIDLFTTEGCGGDGGHHDAVGRQCRYTDGDQGVTWEQWWIDGLDMDRGGGPATLESGPDELWAVMPVRHRDERCANGPDEWDSAWRSAG